MVVWSFGMRCGKRSVVDLTLIACLLPIASPRSLAILSSSAQSRIAKRRGALGYIIDVEIFFVFTYLVVEETGCVEF